MRAPWAIGLVAVALAALSPLGCESTCDEDRCAGCCGSDGLCYTAPEEDDLAHCGTEGVACIDCSEQPSRRCRADRAGCCSLLGGSCERAEDCCALSARCVEGACTGCVPSSFDGIVSPAPCTRNEECCGFPSAACVPLVDGWRCFPR